MAQITFKGTTLNTIGNLPKPGEKAPDFSVTKGDLSETTLKDYAGKKLVLNIFPSIDTPTCQASLRKFNEKAASLENTVILSVSKDLPFALSRFCAAEGLKNVIPTSQYKNSQFGEKYGVTIKDGALEGLFSRAVVVIDEKGTVTYSQQVSDIAQEPDYEKPLAALKEPAKA